MADFQREKLIELKTKFVESFECGDCTPANDKCRKCLTEKETDYLLKNGVIVPPCKVGDTVYVITDCSQIIMHCDNDYETGTGAIECPFEDVCKFEECNDVNTQVFETYVIILLCDEYDDWTFRCEDINRAFSFSDFGKTVFLSREEAEKALAERSENDE